MTTAPTGRLAANVLHFGRLLRAAGLPVGSGQILEATRAVELAGLASRDDMYWALHATMLSRREHKPIFDQAFELFWRDPKLGERAMSMLLPLQRPDAAPEAPVAGARRLADALQMPGDTGTPHEADIEIDAAMSASEEEVLRKKDFEQMSLDELAEARSRVARIALGLERVATRRWRPAAHGPAVDLRRSFRATLRAGGDVIALREMRRRLKPPPIVAICDISGSMSRYSRVFLHFLHALTAARRREGQRVSTFVFGTRLDNVTRSLRLRDVDDALASVAAEVTDWGGGTRIGAALRDFNWHWARRTLAQGAIVMLMTDGLDRDGAADLGIEMERLHKSCRRLIWLNPLLRFDGFEPRATGIKAMLPHVDEFKPMYNVASLADLADALRRPGLRSLTTPMKAKSA